MVDSVSNATNAVIPAVGTIGANVAAVAAILDNKPDQKEQIAAIATRLMGVGVALGGSISAAALGDLSLPPNLPNLVPAQGRSMRFA
jgi:hypothetical protein